MIKKNHLQKKRGRKPKPKSNEPKPPPKKKEVENPKVVKLYKKIIKN